MLKCVRFIPAVLSYPALMLSTIYSIHNRKVIWQLLCPIIPAYTIFTLLHVLVWRTKSIRKQIKTTSEPHHQISPHSLITCILDWYLCSFETPLHQFLPCCLCGAILHVIQTSVVHDCESHPLIRIDSSVRSIYCAAIKFTRVIESTPSWRVSGSTL